MSRRTAPKATTGCLATAERENGTAAAMSTPVETLPMLATPKQVAFVMGPTEPQIRALVRDGRIAHVQVGKRLMIPRDEIKRFIQENTVQPCRVETKVPTSTGTAAAPAGTSPGASEAAAASAALARQTAKQLKSRLANSSERMTGAPALVIPLRSG